MEGLVTLLLFAGIFYLMMRFGCGAHAVHGHGGGGHAGHGSAAAEHSRHDGSGQAMARAVDPVCGMEVAPRKGYTKSHGGREYRLCSRACLDKFEADPEQYVQPHGGHQ